MRRHCIYRHFPLERTTSHSSSSRTIFFFFVSNHILCDSQLHWMISYMQRSLIHYILKKHMNTCVLKNWSRVGFGRRNCHTHHFVFNTAQRNRISHSLVGKSRIIFKYSHSLNMCLRDFRW